MNVPQEDLNKWRRFFSVLVQGMEAAERELDSNGLGSKERVRAILHETAAAGTRMGIRLEQAGAQRPPEMRPAPETPLELLDTPANRRYLAALRECWEAGLAVDRERYGDTIGTDGEAQIIEMVLRDKELEVLGPARDESRVG